MSSNKFIARNGLAVGTMPVDIVDSTGTILVNAPTATKLQTARTISLSGDVAGSVSFDGTGNAAITTTIQPDSVALGTDTTGNYMVNVSAGTGVSVSHTQGEGSTATVSIGQAVGTTDNVTFNNVTVNGTLTSDDITSTNISVAGNATITGNLTVSGTTTTVNSTTVALADLNLELARNATTAAQANGAGITVTGPATPATLTYTSADDRWNLNKNLNVTTVYGALSGNASTATTLQTARTINGTSFDGSANISFSTTAVSEGTNLYYTDARSRAALSFTAGSGAYNSTTGVITIPTNTNQLTNGAGFITGYTETDTLATVTGRGATANTSLTVNSTADGIFTINKSSGTTWGYINFSYGGTRKFYFGINASNEPELGTDNSSVFRVVGSMTIGGNTAYHAGNLTNLNQLTNGPGYLTGTKVDSITATSPIVASASTGAVTLSHANSGVTAGTYNNVTVNALGHVTGGSNTSYLTSYTETDTLATVTARGASTSTASTFSGGITANVTGTLVSPNGSTVTAADSAMPSAANSLLYTLGYGPSGNDGHIIGMTWTSSSIYGAQMWLDTDPTNRMAIRSRNSSGVWNGWSEVLTSNNISSYAVTAEADTLATVTARGATTSTGVTFSGALNAISSAGTYIGDSTAKLWIGGSGGVNYIESGNNAWNANASLYITGYNGATGGTININFTTLQRNGNTVLDASNYQSYLGDYTYGNYRVIADYSSSGTWYIRSNGTFIWARAHDWTQSFTLNLGNGTAASNNGWAELGQNTSNNAAGTWFGTRFVQYTGSAKIDGYVRAGRYYLGDDTNYITSGGAGAIRSQTSTGYIDVGSMNASWAHFQTDRPSFYFNKDVSIDGQLYKYGGGAYYHTGNLGLTLTNSSNGINPDNVTQNQIGYNTSVTLFGQTDGGLYSSAYSSSWIHQIYGDFRTGQIAIRGKNSGTWQSWRTVLDSSNFTSYVNAPNRAGVSYYQASTWLQFTGNTYGLYWSSPGGSFTDGYAEIYAQNTYTYGTFMIEGRRNSYSGVVMYPANAATMMWDSGGNGGFYNPNWDWPQYFNYGNKCTGFNGSTTSSSYAVYVNGSLYASGNLVAGSDGRHKKNVITVDNALEKVLNLRGVYYEWIENDNKTQGRQVGVIAQEVNEILPEVVTYAEDVDRYSVDYGKMAGVFIEAIKELNAQIKELKQEIRVLKGE